MSLTLLFLPTGAGGGVNVNASIAAMTLTEYPATITAGINIQAATDALVLTTYDATVQSSVEVLANTASLTLTTYQADVSIISSVSIRGHLIKRRRNKRKIIYWDEIEKLNQEKIEEAAIEIIKEEKRLEKELLVAERTKEVIKNQVKLKQLQNKIIELEQAQIELQEQKEKILRQIEFLQEEDDIEAILAAL